MASKTPEIDSSWANSWETNDIQFHINALHPLIEKHIGWLLNGRKNAAIFFPFCGKAHDMKWLYDQGHVIVGVEGVEMAVKQFFDEHSLKYITEDTEKFKIYKTEDGRLRLYVGNYYDMLLTGENKFDAVWDRGAMEAVFPDEHQQYVKVMTSLITSECRLLVEICERDDNKGPPHFIPITDLKKLFGDEYVVTYVDAHDPFNNSHPIFKSFQFYSVERKRE